MSLKNNEEIIKRHVPDWAQWHDHCKKQVLDAMAEKDKIHNNKNYVKNKTKLRSR